MDIHEIRQLCSRNIAIHFNSFGSSNNCENILWTTPSAADPRPFIAHCCGIPDSRHCCKRILAFWYPNLSSSHLWPFQDAGAHNKGRFVAHGCYLACLVPLLWRLGGPWDDLGAILGRSWGDCGTLEGTGKDPVRPRLGFYRFCIDLGTPFATNGFQQNRQNLFRGP